ncbi:MAG: flagellar biosynthesis protein FlhB [Planctomycetaceae bacterium]
MADNDQKTHDATPKRRQDARDKGQIPYSAEFVQGALLLAGVATLWVGAAISDGMQLSVRNGLADLRTNMSPADVHTLAGQKLWEYGATIGPLMLTVLLTVLAIGGVQSGGNISLTALMPDPKRLSPASGISKLASSRSLMRTLVSLLKVSGVAAIAMFVINAKFNVIETAGRGSLATAIRIGWEASVGIALAVAGSMVVVGAIDLIYQRWKHEQDLKMSFEEVKEDHKQQEGDPMVRARLRRLQRERANNRMMQEVPEATVVITNPTHISVALKYERSTMAAPIIVAMGADEIALRIRTVAKEHGIPIVEEKPLARALFASAEVGDEIPVQLYQAVASILQLILRNPTR